MKIEFYTFIKEPLPVNKYKGELRHETETIRATYIASSGLLDTSYINYNQSGNVYDSEAERRRVSTKNSWNVKI